MVLDPHRMPPDRVVHRRTFGFGPGQASAALWKLTQGSKFANDMGLLTIDGATVEFLMEQARPHDNGDAILEEVIRTAL